jgi:hypothetical protein
VCDCGADELLKIISTWKLTAIFVSLMSGVSTYINIGSSNTLDPC